MRARLTAVLAVLATLAAGLIGAAAPARAVGECASGWTFVASRFSCYKAVTTAGAVVLPAWVSTVNYVVTGGGGGGQNSASAPDNLGKGGGGAQVLSGSASVGAGITVSTVGAGGAGGSVGGNGGSTSVTIGATTLTATGGIGGSITGNGVNGTSSSISGSALFYGSSGAKAGFVTGSGAGAVPGIGGGNGGNGVTYGSGGAGAKRGWNIGGWIQIRYAGSLVSDPSRGTRNPANVAGADEAYYPDQWTSTQYTGGTGASGAVLLAYEVFAATAFTSASATPTNATSLTYTLTFNRNVDVATLTGSDITNAGTSTGCVFAVSGTGPLSFTVTVTGCSEGTVIPTLALNSVQSTDSTPLTGPVYAPAGTTITIDRTAPVVNTPTIATSGGTVVANTATYTNTALTLTATITASLAAGGRAEFYLDGTLIGTDSAIAAADTTVTLALSTGATIRSTLPNSGNITVRLFDLAGNSATSGARVFTADYVVPLVTSFAPAAGQATVTTTLPANFTMTMNTNVSGLGAADFTNAGTSTGCVFTPSAATGTTFTIVATGCTAGTIQPRLAINAVTAVNNFGPIALSPASPAVVLVTATPTISTSPVISAVTGSLTTINSTMSSTMGSWNDGGDPAATSTIQWYSCTTSLAASCTAIVGSTSQTFVPDSTYVGLYLRTVVTRTSIKGSTTANSSNAAGPLAKLPQSITFGALAGRAFSPTPFALSATASSGLTVSYVTTTPTICSVDGNLVTMRAAGTCSITSSQSGNAVYLAATNVTQTFAITKAAQTITLSPATSPLDSGRAYSLSSSAPGTGTRTYTVTSGAAYCAISGTTLTTSGTGSCTVTVTIATDAAYNAATSTASTYTVAALPGPTTVSDTSSGEAGATQTIAVLGNDSPVSTFSLSTVKLCSAGETTCTRTTVAVTGQGAFSVQADGTVLFVPDSGFNGTVTAVSYQVKNTTALAVSNRSAITVTVLPPPAAIAVDDAVTGAYGTAVVFHPAANDSAGSTPSTGFTVIGTVALDPTSIRLCGASDTSVPCTATTLSTVDGSYSVNVANGDITFTPVAGFSGIVTVPVRYSITNSPSGWTPTVSATSATAALIATVSSPSAPTAVDDTSGGVIGMTQTIAVLANDTPGAGSLDVTTVGLCDPAAMTSPCASTSLSLSGKGTFVVNSDGTVDFIPLPDFRGAVTSVPYQVKNTVSSTYSNQATVSVTVAEDLTLLAADDTVTGGAGSVLTFHPAANDTSITIPAAYTTRGAVSASASTLRLCGTGESPNACTAMSVATTDGTYAVQGNGDVTFTPASGFTGATTVTPTYVICTVATGTWAPATPTSVCAAAALSATVSATPVAPSAVDDSSSGPVGATQSFTPLANDSANGSFTAGSLGLCDPAAASATCTLSTVSVSGEGTWTVSGTTVSFVPDGGFSGNASAVPYQVSNATGASNQALLHAAVVANPSASAHGLTGQGPVGRPIAFDPIAGGSPGSAPNTYTSVGTIAFDPGSVRLCDTGEQVPNCTLTTQSTADGDYVVDLTTGQITFTPAANFSGTATVIPTYVICTTVTGTWAPLTPSSTCDSSTVTATVALALPDAPPPPPLWTLTFDGNGGSCATHSAQAFDSAWLATPGAADCTRTGFRFTGWNTSPTGSGIGFVPGGQTQMSGDNTLYAQWQSMGGPIPAPAPAPAPAPGPSPVGPHLVPQQGTITPAADPGTGGSSSSGAGSGSGILDPLKDAAAEPGAVIDRSSIVIWDGSTWVTSFTDPNVGTWEVVDGNIRFTPVPGFQGTAETRFKVTDSLGGIATGPISFVVPGGSGGQQGGGGGGAVMPQYGGGATDSAVPGDNGHGTLILVGEPSQADLRGGGFGLNGRTDLEPVLPGDYLPDLVYSSTTSDTCTVDSRGRVRMLKPGFCTIVITQPEALIGGRTIDSSSLTVTMHLGAEGTVSETAIVNSRWVIHGRTTTYRSVTSLSQLRGARIGATILFGPDSAVLTRESRATLRRAAQYVKAHGGRLLISGFVRNGGGERTFQQALSENRALVAAELLSDLAPGNLMVIHGYGAIWPEPGSPQDRRVEIRWMA